MTNKQRKQFDEWAVGTIGNTDNDIELDVADGFNQIDRVVYLISLGYIITNWDQYAQAEINEMAGRIINK